MLIEAVTCMISHKNFRSDIYFFVRNMCIVKQVFKDLDFLGWYNTGELNCESDIQIHKQVVIYSPFLSVIFNN